MTNEDNKSLNLEITEAAAEWFNVLRLEPVAEEKRDAFVTWLLRSPTHVEEFLHVMAMHEHFFSELKKKPQWLDEVLSDAKDNVVALSEVKDIAEVTEKESTSTTRVWLKVAAAFAGVAILLNIFVKQEPVEHISNEIISTTIGEQRSVLLDDGSVVDLNTDTQIRIALSDSARYIKLIKGEAIFHVAKDPTRPFRVDADSVMVEAVSTAFNVYRQQDELVVTVVEGMVVVSRKEIENFIEDENERQNDVDSLGAAGVNQSKKLDKVMQLSEGDQVTINQDGNIHEEKAVNLDQVTAWTERRLIFDNETLENIVREFNRYNRSSLSIHDPALAKLRISGVFSANDPEEFLNLVHNLAGTDVELTLDGT